MVTIIKKGSDKKSIAATLKKLMGRRKTKGFDARKYCGTLKLKEDPLAIQKRLRDEWE